MYSRGSALSSARHLAPFQFEEHLLPICSQCYVHVTWPCEMANPPRIRYVHTLFQLCDGELIPFPQTPGAAVPHQASGSNLSWIISTARQTLTPNRRSIGVGSSCAHRPLEGDSSQSPLHRAAPSSKVPQGIARKSDSTLQAVLSLSAFTPVPNVQGCFWNVTPESIR